MIQQKEGKGEVFKAPVYNLVPPPGMPAQLGFQVGALPIYIDTRLRSDGDYGVTAYLRNVTEAQRVTAARVMIWGTPWEESHDSLRGNAPTWAKAPARSKAGSRGRFGGCPAPVRRRCSRR